VPPTPHNGATGPTDCAMVIAVCGQPQPHSNDLQN
jgi:hypothetical protein